MEREGDAGAVILRLHSLIASDRINRDKFKGLKIRDRRRRGRAAAIKRVSHSNSGRSVELSFLSGLAAVISRKSGRP